VVDHLPLAAARRPPRGARWAVERGGAGDRRLAADCWPDVLVRLCRAGGPPFVPGGSIPPAVGPRPA